MPREIFHLNSSEYRNYMSGGLAHIKTIESNPSHHTYLYHVNPTNTNKLLVCDDCKTKADFLLYDDDHMKRVYVQLWCSKHAPVQFIELLEEK